MSSEDTPSTVNARDTRRHLTPDEVKRLIDAVRSNGRHRQRNAAMVLLAYQLGLRVSELCALQRSDVDYKSATISVTRAKGGASAMYPLTGEALRALHAYKRDDALPWLFVTERGGPMSTACVRELLSRAGKRAGLKRSNPHALRHACGYKLVNDGTDLRLVQAYLGHKSLASTERYTAVDTRRFRGLF